MKRVVRNVVLPLVEGIIVYSHPTLEQGNLKTLLREWGQGLTHGLGRVVIR